MFPLANYFFFPSVNQFLLILGAELSAEIKHFRRNVFTACDNGDKSLLLSTLQEEVTEADIVEAVNQLNPEGLTLLQSCAQRSCKEIVW